MNLNRIGVVLVIILLILAASVSFIVFNGQNVSALDENNCLSCHSKLDATKVNSEGGTIHLRISEDDVNSGAHRFIDCTTCHTAKPHDSPPALTKLSSAEKWTCHIRYNIE
jgi:nitrate reductase cytochrome c-type subunit